MLFLKPLAVESYMKRPLLPRMKRGWRESVKWHQPDTDRLLDLPCWQLFRTWVNRKGQLVVILETVRLQQLGVDDYGWVRTLYCDSGSGAKDERGRCNSLLQAVEEAEAILDFPSAHQAIESGVSDTRGWARLPLSGQPV